MKNQTQITRTDVVVNATRMKESNNILGDVTHYYEYSKLFERICPRRPSHMPTRSQDTCTPSSPTGSNLLNQHRRHLSTSLVKEALRNRAPQKPGGHCRL